MISIPEFAFSGGRGLRLGPSIAMNLTSVDPTVLSLPRGICPHQLALRPIGRECSRGSHFLRPPHPIQAIVNDGDGYPQMDSDSPHESLIASHKLT